MTEKISAENHDGNVEYKWYLRDTSDANVDHIASQMKYRLEEGKGEAIYFIGAKDNGEILGINQEDYLVTKSILERAAAKNRYTAKMYCETPTTNELKTYEFLIRENIPQHYVDIRVACAGNVDSGKSSLLGVLTTGKKDDGRGSARLNIFNFKHEITTGRTSSISQHILGFTSSGEVANYEAKSDVDRKKSWPEIIKKSSRVITFFDLCGHEKYLKTTIFGLTSQFPDLVFILVGANMGFSKMTQEHIFLCLSLHIPFVVIITKIDYCVDKKDVLRNTVTDTKKFLKDLNLTPLDVRNGEDVNMCISKINSRVIVPIFYVSNVTGAGIDLLQQLLNFFPKKVGGIKSTNKVEMHIDQTFQVAGIGTVLGGQLIAGTVSVGDKLLVGPIDNEFHTIQVRSIHCKKVVVESVSAGCYVCLGIRKTTVNPRRGHVIISTEDTPTQARSFKTSIIVSHCSTTIKAGFQPVIHVCNIRQTARIVSIRKKDGTDCEVLRRGDRAIVEFEFCYAPEYIRPGLRILMAEGKVKLVGIIESVANETVLKKV